MEIVLITLILLMAGRVVITESGPKRKCVGQPDSEIYVLVSRTKCKRSMKYECDLSSIMLHSREGLTPTEVG